MSPDPDVRFPQESPSVRNSLLRSDVRGMGFRSFLNEGVHKDQELSCGVEDLSGLDISMYRTVLYRSQAVP